MIQGYVDIFSPQSARGWCKADDGQKAKVEIYYNDQKIAEVLADHRRDDLRHLGDNGRFGYYVEFPPVQDIASLSARCQGETLPVINRGGIKRARNRFRLISCDITRHCNNRCRFCFCAWDKPANMDLALWKRLVKILPSYADQYVLVSCLFEPTLHPQFLEIMECIPKEGSEYFFFTSNLARELDEPYFERLAACHFRHMNISLETLEPETYQYLTKNKNSSFYQNLRACAKAFSGGDKPGLRAITMVLRDNYEELPELARYAHDELGVIEHEFRTPYFSTLIDRDYLLGHTVTRVELQRLAEKLDKLGYKNLQTDLRTSNEEYAQKVYSADYTKKDFHGPLWDSGEQARLYWSGPRIARIIAPGYFTMDEFPCAWDMNQLNEPDKFFDFAAGVSQRIK